MLRTHFVAALVAASALASLVACSSSSSTTSSGSSSSGGTPDAGSSSGSADAGDAGGPIVNSCRTYADHTADSTAPTIPWDFSIIGSDLRCIKIKVGQSVTWNGNFTTHPLAAGDGDPANPIANADLSGATTTVAFPVSGTYGYHCTVHPALLGAIEVVP